MASRSLTVTAALLLLTLARAAAAQPSAADRETARTLMDDGDRKAEVHDDSGALRSYRAADGIMHVPSTGIEVAKILARMGQLLEARDAALALIRLPKADPEPAPYVAARAEAERLAAALGSRIPALAMQVTGLAPREFAVVRVDGEAVTPEALPLPRRANPGAHHIVASAAGRADVVRDVQLAEGQTAPVELAFGPALQASVSPLALPVLPPATLPEAPRASRSPGVATWASLGVGAAGLVAGTIVGVLELSKASTVKGQCHGNACAPSARGDLNDANTLATVSDVALGVGVVGVALGAVFYFMAPSTPVQPSVGLVRGGGSVGVGGAF